MLESDSLPAEILGVSAAAVALREFVDEAVRDDLPVLLTGEAGTGKQHVARTIHERSGRSRGPLLMIDCSLYYERELKRELFGYGGPGTAGKDRQGILEFADRGVCYLSHVEEVSPSIQNALLGFLKTGRLCRLGDGREVRSSVRLVLSSEKNLEGFVRAGLVSRELFDAIRHCHSLVPLRDRCEDVPAIAEALLAARSGDGAPGESMRLTSDSLEALRCYPWPANIDELFREIDRLADAGRTSIGTEHLAMEIASYWLGQRGDPETRRVLEELDGYIREFRVLSRIGCDFGGSECQGVGFDPASSEEEEDTERDYLEEF